MKEVFLQYIWANSLFNKKGIRTLSGQKLEIIDIGQLNRDAGPDFFNAQLRIDDLIWAGNVEIHISNSDWVRHGHQLDAAYDNVILSVVTHADVDIYNSQGRKIETMVLEDVERLYVEYLHITNADLLPGCKQNVKLIDPFIFNIALQTLSIERLERKCMDISLILKQTQNDWEECFYRLMCKYWSGNVNAEPFYQLALHLPYRLLLRYLDKPIALESLLFGVAGLLEEAIEDTYVLELKSEFYYLKNKHNLYVMPDGQWKFMRIRPNAFPTIRLSLFASFLKGYRTLLSKILELTELKDVYTLLDVQVSEYWKEHYRFGLTSIAQSHQMGNQIKQTLIINAIIPFVFLYGKEMGEEKYIEKSLSWLEAGKAENNYIVKKWIDLGFGFNSATQTQALIELTKNYCEKHRCLECRIAKEVLKYTINN